MAARPCHGVFARHEMARRASKAPWRNATVVPGPAGSIPPCAPAGPQGLSDVGAPGWSRADHDGMQDWYAAFTGWLGGSFGADEADADSNHGTFFDMQPACCRRRPAATCGPCGRPPSSWTPSPADPAGDPAGGRRRRPGRRGGGR
jgi:hypothetical protein